MLIKTLLNKCYPVKHFVYGKVSLVNDHVVVAVSRRQNSLGQCSQCLRMLLDTID